MGVSQAFYESLLPQKKRTSFSKQFIFVGLLSDQAPKVNCMAISRLILKSGCSPLVCLNKSITRTKSFRTWHQYTALKLVMTSVGCSQPPCSVEGKTVSTLESMEWCALQLSTMSATFLLDCSISLQQPLPKKFRHHSYLAVVAAFHW